VNQKQVVLDEIREIIKVLSPEFRETINEAETVLEKFYDQDGAKTQLDVLCAKEPS
jgi:hypothetical protein